MIGVPTNFSRAHAAA